ncbi:MAG: rubrerythrin family protein [Rikenellaceae bacterium]
MKTIKGTLTEQNLLKAFAGESQARNRYTFFASKAKKDGFEQVAAIFLETAEQEKEHAKVFFKYLEGGELTITASFPAGIIASTPENLAAAAAGEYEEWDIIYREAAATAESEGFLDIAESFRQIALVEMQHEKRYLTLLKRFNDGDFFTRENPTQWQCRNCGYVTEEGTTPPDLCPACKHRQAYFEPLKENI